MKKFILGLFVLLAFQFTVAANDYYAVQVGVFLNPKLSDFESVRALGFLYAEEDGGNTYRVYVGDFDAPQEAESIAKKLKEQGYLDAFVARRTATLGASAAVIQLATRAPKERINWDNFFKIGDVYALSENNQVKIITGIYNNINEAKGDLSRVRNSGFSDAFPKVVNSARLHQLGNFELGDYKKALIPIEISSAPATSKNDDRAYRDRDMQTKGYDPAPPSSYETATTDRVNAKTTASSNVNFDLPMPRIRTNVKRKSALDLQKTLKQLGTYNSSLDGYYGDGTSSGFVQAANANATYRRYKLLAEMEDDLSSSGAVGNLQRAIDDLPSNAGSSLRMLENSSAALAKAYRAYWLFQSSGASPAVNNLMNDAIRTAYQQQDRNSAPLLPIDPRSTYAYNDINQVVRHLDYVYTMQNDGLKKPCWLLTRHANEISNSGNVSEECNGFYQWEVTRVMQAISDDLASGLPTKDGASLSKLYLTPKPLSQTEIQGLTSWNDILWQNMKGWESVDPLHQRLVTGLKLAYFQTQVQLEDHYMDKGFAPAQAKGLALATLKAMIGQNLERFM